jgi:hypothetical protein
MLALVGGDGGKFFTHLPWCGTLSQGRRDGQKRHGRSTRPSPARVRPPWLPPHGRTPAKQLPAAWVHEVATRTTIGNMRHGEWRAVKPDGHAGDITAGQSVTGKEVMSSIPAR